LIAAPKNYGTRGGAAGSRFGDASEFSFFRLISADQGGQRPLCYFGMFHRLSDPAFGKRKSKAKMRTSAAADYRFDNLFMQNPNWK
jgi:hypothetical protein